MPQIVQSCQVGRLAHTLGCCCGVLENTVFHRRCLSLFQPFQEAPVKQEKQGYDTEADEYNPEGTKWNQKDRSYQNDTTGDH